MENLWIGFVIGLVIGIAIFKFVSDPEAKHRRENRLNILETEKW